VPLRSGATIQLLVSSAGLVGKEQALKTVMMNAKVANFMRYEFLVT
jgi:hypothetical protein